MTICVDSGYQKDAGCFSSLEESEELRPIRVGALAQQPAPDVTAIIYLGLADLLPVDVRVICSSAGLFFARILCEYECNFELEVAALAHYFESDDVPYERHVRTFTLGKSQFGQLLEWDRRLAGMATCDVIDEMIDHVCSLRQTAQQGEFFQTPTPLGAQQQDTTQRTEITSSSLLTAPNASQKDQEVIQPSPVTRPWREQEPKTVTLVEGPSVELSSARIKQMINQHEVPSGQSLSLRRFRRILLKAALEVAPRQEQWAIRRALRWQEQMIEVVPRVQSIAKRKRTPGGPEVEITGCLLKVYVPQRAA